MQGINFRISRADEIWTWRTLGPEGLELDRGESASRSGAAAMVIRSIVRAETGDPHAGPKSAMARAA